MRVLVVNTGSSSVKLRLLDEGELAGSTDLGAPSTLDDSDWSDAIAALAGESGVDAAGHRIVHGGPDFTAPVVVDDKVRSALEAVVELAPLHLPASLAGLDAVRSALPSVPSIGCFDTAFHATMPAAATTYAVPAAWRSLGVRRYGFHGLSHAYSARRAAEILGRPVEDLRLVSCHLGAGASLCAVHSGRSVDTTMGFTPLEGVVMATRSGSVDPGLVLWLQRQRGLSADEVSDGLERHSGLLGLAGTADMREVLSRMSTDDQEARLAFEVYVHRLKAAIAAMAASMSGVDAVSFTGGVGERAPAVREGAVAGLEYLGLAVNPGQNEAARGDANVSAPGVPASVAVVTAREDLEIAAQVSRLLG
ncbi:MAG TPA: acetate/propionate family kinase [Mycobacteriales bacterium]|jgi:acetate kinase|nr:acetate/propionate family kinase [Mycobacteriales bacterium]